VASRSAKPTRVNAARPASEHGDGWRGPSRSREVPGQSTSPQRRHCSVSRYQHVALGRHVAVRLGGPVLARGQHTAACREKQQPRARFTPTSEPTGPFEGDCYPGAVRRVYHRAGRSLAQRARLRFAGRPASRYREPGQAPCSSSRPSGSAATVSRWWWPPRRVWLPLVTTSKAFSRLLLASSLAFIGVCD
jgi:hypothetical protein